MSACHSRIIPGTIPGNEDVVIKIGGKVTDLMKSIFFYRSQMRNKDCKICYIVINAMKNNKAE